MTSPERLTIDAERERHALAVELFELAKRGQVELSTAPQGLPVDISGDLAEQVREAFGREEVQQAPQLAYPSAVTYPGKNLFPGRYVEGFAEA